MSFIRKLETFLPTLNRTKVHGFEALELTTGTYFITPEGDSYYLAIHDDSGFDFAFRNGTIVVSKKEFGELERLEIKTKTHVPALLYVDRHTYLVSVDEEKLKQEFSISTVKSLSLPLTFKKLKDAVTSGDVINKVFRVKTQKGIYGNGIGVSFLNEGIFVSSDEVYLVNLNTHEIKEKIDLDLDIKPFALAVNGIVIIGFLKINKYGEIRIRPVLFREEE